VTGVGDRPTTFDQYVRVQGKKTTALERQLSLQGALDLSTFIVAGQGIAIDGVGTSADPMVVSSTVVPTTIYGTEAQRALSTSQYWQFWQATDGAQDLYVGNRSGGWRKFSGQVSNAVTAWDNTITTGSPSWTAGARTATLTIPTVLETNEVIILTQYTVGSGYGFVGLNGITRNVSNTSAVVRFFQAFSTTTQSFSVNWQIMQV
jgi:hypothetical protein